MGIVRLGWELSVLGGNFPFSLCQSSYIDVRTIYAKSYENWPINKKNTVLGGGGGGGPWGGLKIWVIISLTISVISH